MLDNVGLRYPHRASGAKAPRTLRPLPLLRFAVSATGGAHLCSIQYYLRFWLSSCRTSLAVSALRIMRYCLKFFRRSLFFKKRAEILQNCKISAHLKFKAIPHNSKCRYGERGAADAKPKAQIILDVLSSILATQMPCRSCRSGA